MREPSTFRAYLQKVFTKEAAMLIVFLLLLFQVFIVYFYHVYFEAETKSAGIFAEQQIESELSRCQNGLDDFAKDPLIIQALQGHMNKTAISERLYAFSQSSMMREDFLLLTADGKPLVSSLYQDNVEFALKNEDFITILHKTERPSDSLLSAAVDLPFQHGQQTGYAFFRSVFVDGHIAGYLVFFLRQDGFRVLTDQWTAEHMIIYDAFDHVIYSTNPAFVDPLGKMRVPATAAGEINVEGRAYYASRADDEKGKLHVMALTSVPHRQVLIQAVLLFVALAGLAAFVLLYFAVGKLTNQVLRPVEELLAAVREIRSGNLGYQLETRSGLQEFQILYEELNHMVQEINRLMQSNAELAERKRLMEVRQLEGQLNPHFAFNVLEALRYEILFNPQRASELAVSFARLMRYSIHRDEGLVPLRIDLQYIKDYLMLQKMRLGSRLSYTVQIPEELLACEVPKLLLQPVVENSIVHGLERARYLHISLKGWQQNDDMILLVEDDGTGMTLERLAEVQALLKKDHASPEHIGLYNVHRMLRVLFGDAYGLTIEGDTNGVRVVMRLPVRKKVDIDVDV